MNKGIREFLEEHKTLRPVSFHMPGHKGGKIYREKGYGSFLDFVMDCDITEITGADNLFQAESIIAETMEKYQKLYDCRKSYMLINGSSGGIIAAILASVKKGGKLAMARNCHKSVFNGVALGGITPWYIHPETVEEYGIQGAITVETVEKALEDAPDTEAVILPSPNYYGICSDIKAIAEAVHRRGKILIVDQAHGAHLKFFKEGMPKAAEELGADIVINSTHKTLASFTQTAILNVCSDRVDLMTLEDKLQIMESSSPSYPLMATLDINADLIAEHGTELMTRWKENIDRFYEESTKIAGLKLMNTAGLDRTKLNIDMSAYGFDGSELEEYLMTKNIFVELVSGNIIMCMTGIGNKWEDYEKLLSALKELADTHEIVEADKPKQPKTLTRKMKWAGIPDQKNFVPIAEGAGKVCASAIIPYPPGIPIVCPGEVLDGESLKYVAELRSRGHKVIGVDGLGRIAVGKE